ncbi:MAG: amino acid adenylation domain-containing protein, partial [Myxococcota bacterium]
MTIEPMAPPKELLPDAFARAARVHAHRPAVKLGTQVLSYAELNAWADKIAGTLAAEGIGPEHVVGLLLDRSLATIAALLGVLKTGAAYMPLAPHHPAARLRDQIVEASASAVLVASAHDERPRLGAPSVRWLNIQDDALARPIGKKGDEKEDLNKTSAALCRRPHPENAINVIFTSGSTGKPKGVVSRQGALENRITWMHDTYGLSEDDKVLQKTPLTFDVSGWEIFWPLTRGATLVLARPDGHKDPDYLAELIEAEAITIVHFVPSMLAFFLQAHDLTSRCRSLRMIFSSGEALSTSLLTRCHAAMPCAVHNLYGPTEAAIDVTAWRGERGWTRPVPIGRPIRGCRAHILDLHLRPVARGNPGELYLGGDVLARGYVNSARLTAERFIPDPWSPTPGARLYRTGDLARWVDNDTIEHLGRIDTQIKLHGRRIELTEIEARLEAHPGIDRAAVCCIEPTGHSARLVGLYTQIGGAQAIHPPALRRALAAYLPDDMIPQHFFACERLPLTDSGKLDRRALVAEAQVLLPPSPSPSLSNEALPQTPRQTLRRLWTKILLGPSVSDDDNFFERGGDSIQALMLAAQAQRAGLDLTARDLYEHRTLAALTSAVEDRQGTQRVGPDYAQRPAVNRIPLVPIQSWFFEHAPDGLDHWNQSVRLQCRAPVHPESLERAFRALLARHDAFSLRFEKTANGWEAAYDASIEASGRFEHLRLGAEEPAIEASERAQRRLNIREGPLAHLLLLSTCGDSPRDQILFVIHHLVVDGVSWRVLIPELEALYRAARRGASIHLPRPAVAWGQWSLHLSRRAAEGAFEGERALWRRAVGEPANARIAVSSALPGRNLGRDLQIHSITLTADDTAVTLRALPRFYGARINKPFTRTRIYRFRSNHIHVCRTNSLLEYRRVLRRSHP